MANVQVKEAVNCRDVLWCLVFCGFAINYMLRINLNLAIVAMVIPHPKAAADAQCDVEKKINTWSNDTSTYNVTDSPVLPIAFPENITHDDRFAWSEYEQGLTLGAYYWLHWITQLPGGLLARRYGTKLVFGWANLATALLGFLVPIATRYHLYALIFVRAIQGLVAGFVWPAMHDMTAKWIPPNERSKFISAYLGSSVGAAITYPLCAFVSNWFGWEAAFYVTSLLGVIWYCFWLFLVFDSPQQHPRITIEEKSYILENLAGSVVDREKSVPWKEILTSGPMWINIASMWGTVWGFLTLMTQAPSYFNYVHGWNISTTGILSGLPHIMRMIFSYLFSCFSDWLLRSKRMTRTNVRKFATFICTAGQAILTLGLGLSGCQPFLAIFFMIAGTAVNGAVSAGPLTNFVDLSPNYASVLMGLSGLVTVFAGFISPIIVGVLTNNNQTINQWRLVFIIAAVNLMGSCIIFTLFGTSDEQSWNNYVKSDEEKGEEMQKLKPKVENEAYKNVPDDKEEKQENNQK